MSQASDPESSVLIVCHANICRSPLAEYLLSSSLVATSWAVRSAGTHARNGTGICPDVRGAIVWRPEGSDFATAFVSRPVREEDLRAGMILTASAAEKSLLAQRDHTTRRRTFTLREAAALVGAESSGRLGEAAGPAEVAEHLDELRRGGALTLTARTGSLDIDDPHRGQRAGHGTVLTEIVDAVDRLSRGLRPSAA